MVELDEYTDFSVLFTRNDFESIAFHMAPSGKIRQKVKELIENNAGILYDQFPMDKTDFMIRLVRPNETILTRGEDFFDCKYIENCVQEGKLLPNLLDYRVNERSKYKNYDPYLVMVGELRWQDVERRDEGEVVLFEDFDRNHEYQRFKENSRNLPYSKAEDMAIINYIKSRKLFGLVDGNRIWKNMEYRKICESRTYQSMKNRFKRNILPSIKSYPISDKEVFNFVNKRASPDWKFSDDSDERSPSPNPRRRRQSTDHSPTTRSGRDRSGSRQTRDHTPSRRTNDNCPSIRAPDHSSSRPELDQSAFRRASDRSPSTRISHRSSSRQARDRSRETHDSSFGFRSGRDDRRKADNDGVDREEYSSKKAPKSSAIEIDIDPAPTSEHQNPSNPRASASGVANKNKLSSETEVQSDSEPFRVIQRNEELTDDISRIDEQQPRDGASSAPHDDAHQGGALGEENYEADAPHDNTGGSSGACLNVSELRDVGQQRNAPVDPIFGFSAQQSVTKRTFSTDSERSPRKKRRLYCPETSQLNEAVFERLRSSHIPSPVQSGSLFQKEKNHQDLTLGDLSSQDFAAGLRPATDSSSAGGSVCDLESTDGGGGITSTQNLLDTSTSKQQPEPTAPVEEALEVYGESNSQELNLFLQPSSDMRSEEEQQQSKSPNLAEEPASNPLMDKASEYCVNTSNNIFVENQLGNIDLLSDEGLQDNVSPPEAGTVEDAEVEDLNNTKGTDHESVGGVVLSPLHDVDSRGTEDDRADELETGNQNNVEGDQDDDRGLPPVEPPQSAGQNIDDEDENNDDLPGILSNGEGGNENEVIINDDEEHVEESDQDESVDKLLKASRRVRNPTNFRTTGYINSALKNKNKAATHKAITIHLPSDISSSDVELVRTSRRNHQQAESSIEDTTLVASSSSPERTAAASNSGRKSRINKDRRRSKGQVDPKLARPAATGNKHSRILSSESSDDDDDLAPIMARGGREKASARRPRIESDDEDGSDAATATAGHQARNRNLSGISELAQIVARSPPSACCKTFNSASGLPIRRRSSAAARAAREEETDVGGAARDASPENESSTEEEEEEPIPGPSHRDPVRPEKSKSKKGQKSKLKVYTTGTSCSTANNTMSKFRMPYTMEEEKKLIKYFLKHGGFSKRAGNMLWKKLEAKNHLPGRSWQSMRQRFKVLVNGDRLEQFGTSIEQLKEADKEVYRIESSDEEEEEVAEGGGEEETGAQGVEENRDEPPPAVAARKEEQKKKGGPKKLYTMEEDKKILRFICQNNRYEEVGGINIWRIMEERRILGDRTYHSMKERFRKVLLKNIENYDLSNQELSKFERVKEGKKANDKERRHKQ